MQENSDKINKNKNKQKKEDGSKIDLRKRKKGSIAGPGGC